MGNSQTSRYWCIIKDGWSFFKWSLPCKVIVQFCRHYCSMPSGEFFFFYRFSIFPLNSGPLTPSINLLLLMQPEPEFRPAMSEVVLYLLNMIKRESHKSDSNEKWEWWWYLFMNWCSKINVHRYHHIHVTKGRPHLLSPHFISTSC
jgi:hypothetical protein